MEDLELDGCSFLGNNPTQGTSVARLQLPSSLHKTLYSPTHYLHTQTHKYMQRGGGIAPDRWRERCDVSAKGKVLRAPGEGGGVWQDLARFADAVGSMLFTT